jgi:hypothetical protein
MAASCPVATATARNSTSAIHSSGVAVASVCNGWTKNQSNVSSATTEATTAGLRPKRMAVGSTTRR